MSNEKQYTAVEYMFNEITLEYVAKGILSYMDIVNITQKAKEIEKCQIKDAFVNGFCNANDTEDKSLNSDEIFYRTRYGGNK